MKHRLVPDSLFWRLILVLFAGLLVSQLISMVINYEDRDQLLSRTTGRQSAQRITDTVQLLDLLNPSERNRIVSMVNVPPQRVTLRQTPIVVGDEDTKSTSVQLFSSMLLDELGADRQIRVAQTESTTAVVDMTQQHGMGRGMGHGRRRMMQQQEYDMADDHSEQSTGISFLVQVQLLDGQWVAFDTYTPKTPAVLPLRLLVTLSIFLIVVLLLSFVAVRWLTRPLHQLANAADALGRDINQQPLPETGPVEIRQAAHAFNLMQQRLKHFIQDRTHIFAAMSHDLKTPITRLRLRAEMLDDDEQRERFERDLKEMEFMVTEALDFMKGLDTKQQQQPVNMMALLESVQADYVDAGKTVTITGTSTLPFMGFAPLLKRALVNLLDNAIFYGHQAHIIIEDNEQFLTIRIQDEGSGIAEAEQDKAFEAFYRLEHSRNRETGGTGLGLTIARNITQTHGGEISLSNRPQGGLEVVLVLPRKLTVSS